MISLVRPAPRLVVFMALILWSAAGPALAESERPNQQAGVVHQVVVPGESLKGALAGYDPDRPVAIYLPAAYVDEPQRRFPVIYALHGFGDSGLDWSGFLRAPEAFDRAIERGAQPAIVVMPNAMTPLGGAMFSNSVTTGNWEGFIAKDLVAWVDANYRTLARRESRGLVGFSMGGYGALRIAMKHPDVFSSIYSMSACCLSPAVSPIPEPGALRGFVAVEDVKTPEQAVGMGFGAAVLAMAAAWSPNPANPPFFSDLPTKNGVPQPDVIAAWSANAVLSTIHQYVPALRSLGSISIEVGTRDFLAADNRRLGEILARYGIEHKFETYDGGHGDRVSERFETHVLPHFSDALAHHD